MAMTPQAIDRLKASLLTSGIQQQNNALFFVIDQLINAVRDSLTGVQTITGGGGGGGGGILGQTFLTEGNDQATLPNSRQLLPGNGINFNNNGQRIVIDAAIPFALDGIDGVDGIGIPGIQGIQGPVGPIGPPGIDALVELYEPVLWFPSVELAGMQWNNTPFNAGDYTADSSTWTVASGDVTANVWTRVNKVLIWSIAIAATSSIGAGNTGLSIAIPGGMTTPSAAGSFAVKPAYVYENGAVQLDFVVQVGGSTNISIHRGGGALNSGNFALYFTMIMRIN